MHMVKRYAVIHIDKIDPIARAYSLLKFVAPYARNIFFVMFAKHMFGVRRSLNFYSQTHFLIISIELEGLRFSVAQPCRMGLIESRACDTL